MVIDQAEFDAERWYRILQNQKVTVWYTAPTAVRMLMKVGADFAKRFDLSKLRLMASVGEPLNPEAVVWGVEAFGKRVAQSVALTHLAALERLYKSLAAFMRVA